MCTASSAQNIQGATLVLYYVARLQATSRLANSPTGVFSPANALHTSSLLVRASHEELRVSLFIAARHSVSKQYPQMGIGSASEVCHSDFELCGAAGIDDAPHPVGRAEISASNRVKWRTP